MGCTNIGWRKSILWNNSVGPLLCTLLLLILLNAHASLAWTIESSAAKRYLYRISNIESSSYHSSFLHESKPRTALSATSPEAASSTSTSSHHSANVAVSPEELIAIGRAELHKFFSFPLDDWQLQAGGAICKGYNVIVCAPTGAGKTVVGEMALLHAYHVSKQFGIYTTPLKALSNQKYSDLRKIFGGENTGLSTGDISINKGAQIRVMTTEVYRNIAWRSSTPSASMLGTDELSQNAVVVLDEFHYMGNPGRGGVWEESVITSPAHTQIIGLSATLANAHELVSWMGSVTAKTTLLVEVPGQKRPVPLRYLFANKKGLFPLFRDPDAGPGAAKGLLGYRGDGEAPKGQQALAKKGKKKGFGAASDDNESSNGLPPGLQVNPALRAAANERLQKVERTLEQRKKRDIFRSVGDEGAFSMPKKLMSSREERREKDRLLRNEMRREVPSLSVLLSRLKQKKLLPAIFFIFSRVGCDEAARGAYRTMKGPKDPDRLLDVEFEQFGMEPDRVYNRKPRTGRKRGGKSGGLLKDKDGRLFRPESNFVSEDVLSSYLDDSSVNLNDDEFDESSPLSPGSWEYYSKAGLLSLNEVREVASRISVFNDENAEIAFDDEISEQLLFGVGSHHAGMLPAHKSFVEILFRRQLMKCVFATETLAAGINMPARTTVVCSMAKRGNGSSISLLETSTLLQMAGRAGRRGFDDAGTCVVVATPFETHDDAAKILTDPMKPIESQFTPSYSLAVNLIARGEGKLEVARQLVSKSFAAWGKRTAEESVNNELEKHGNGASEVLQVSAQERFMNVLVDTLQSQVNDKNTKYDIATVAVLIETLTNRETLKKASKSYISLRKALELEEITLSYLSIEADQAALDAAESKESREYGPLVDEDLGNLDDLMSKQQARTEEARKSIQLHPFTTIVTFSEAVLKDGSPEGESLRSALANARGTENIQENGALSASELTSYAKAAVVVNRKTRKLAKANPGLDPASLLLQIEQVNKVEDSSWDDMLAITKTLLSYGCITADSPIDRLDRDDEALETATFSLTPAGMNVGMLGFENSLWAMVAIGGAWCVDTSAMQDENDSSWDAIDDDEIAFDTQKEYERPEQEAEKLVSLLCGMDPAEFSGYISAIVSEGSRSNSGGPDVLSQFRGLTPSQQRVIQSSLLVMERLMEVQTMNSVDSGTRTCNFDISNVAVVTAWASGCAWNDAVQLSGLPPGDLVRTLGRVLDAVRQLGNLPYEPIRKGDLWVGGGEGVVGRKKVSPAGIHPEVRRLCREAVKAINRYPVKDPLAFETPIDEAEVEEFEDDDGNVVV